jgi:hypothetical protein
MRRRDRIHHAAQPDLFHPLQPTPDWRSLPPGVREKATRLLVRLLRERQQTSRCDQSAGGRDDE